MAEALQISAPKSGLAISSCRVWLFIPAYRHTSLGRKSAVRESGLPAPALCRADAGGAERGGAASCLGAREGNCSAAAAAAGRAQEYRGAGNAGAAAAGGRYATAVLNISQGAVMVDTGSSCKAPEAAWVSNSVRMPGGRFNKAPACQRTFSAYSRLAETDRQAWLI